MTPGDRIASKYRLVRRLGDGSMGEVWAAVNERTEGEVALKLIVSPSAELRERLLREARACGRLRHRNIVEVHDVGETSDGEPFLVMQLLHGETLRERIERGPIPARQAAALAIDVARALRAAHAAGIIHRDLKPANVFLHREADVEGETVKVLDFGVSKLLATEGGATATVTGSLVGSPAYMSPEQARASKGIDHRTDLWSLGVLLFEMLTGERPFPHKAMLGVIAEILSAPIPAPSDHAAGLPEGIDTVVARCLERDASRRVASAEALIEMLRPFAEAETPRVASLPDAPASPRQAVSPLAIADTEHATVPLHVPAQAGVEPSVDMPTAIFDRSRVQAQKALETAPFPEGGTRPLTAEDIARAGAFASLRRPVVDRAGETEITEDLEDQRRTAPMGKPVAPALLATMPLPVEVIPKPPVPAVTSTTGPLVQSPAAHVDRAAAPSAADIAKGKRLGLALIVMSVLTVVVLVLLGLTIGQSLSGPKIAATASESAAPAAASEAAAEPPSAPVAPAAPAAPAASAADPEPADTVAAGDPGASPSGAASVDAPPRPVTGQRPATLNIVSTPASRVLLDDKPLGTTPRNGIVVTPGTHIVTFQHTLLGKKIMVIQIKAGETKTASVEFGKR